MTIWKIAVITALCCVGDLSAASIYTSSTSFAAAIAGEAKQVEDFSGLTAGQVINPGRSIDGITYTAITSGAAIITSNYSSANSMGLSLGGYNQAAGIDFFQAGDSVTLTFARPTNAVGVFFNSNAFPGNTAAFRVTAGGLTSSTTAQAYDTNTFVFAGLLSDTFFTSATFTGTDFFTVPEIVTAPTPEPGSLILAAAGMLCVLFVVARRRWNNSTAAGRS